MNVHLDEPIIRLNLPPAEHQQVAVIAVHGRTQEPEFMLEQLNRLGWGDLPCLVIRAAGKTWYPFSFLESVTKNEPDLSYALENLTAKINELHDAGFKAEQIILLGFSQGACLLAEYANRNPKRYKGIVCFTGGVIGDEETHWPITGNFDQTPVFLSTSGTDPFVPVARVKKTAEIYKKMNADVSLMLYDAKEHGVSDDEIERVKKIIDLTKN